MMEIIACLRNGVRREIVEKMLEINFLPKEFRHPMGTFTNFVST